jgi:hypothetical protein
LAIVGGVLAVGTRGQDPASPPGHAAPGRGSPGGAVGQGALVQPATVQTLLGRVSLAADQHSAPIRDDQFIYAEFTTDTTFISRDADGRTTTKRWNDAKGQNWTSVNGSKPGWDVSLDKLGHISSVATPAYPRAAIGLRLPTYRYLTTLPTDPDALLALIRASVSVTAGSKPDAVPDSDQEAFGRIGDLIRLAILPPRLAAALYRAAAKIPGVRIVPNAVDAAGRHGIGVARTMNAAAAHPAPGEGGVGVAIVDNLEWIFDAKTYHLLGERLGSKISMNSIAITDAAVVDHARQLPN